MADIIVVDDEENMCKSLKVILEGEGHQVDIYSNSEKALEAFEYQSYDLLITDARMPGMTGYELLKKVKANYPEIVVIMITAYGTTKLTVEAMKSGAYDYITKPFEPEELLFVVAKALDYSRLAHENAELKQSITDKQGVYRIIGQDEKINQIKKLVQTMAVTSSTVLIQGESGTGKELVAKALHYHSDRRQKPFISINCAALPENLLESELFGHEKGAFTGASQQRKGKFELAHQGTLFLDEIGDMSMTLQAKMLRVLQEKQFERVGGNTVLHSNVRIIAATNQNLPLLIQEGNFREDLYYRLNVLHLQMPALRERTNDIPILAYHFLNHFNQRFEKNIQSISEIVLEQLINYSWPGNIRELQNVMERAVLLETKSVLQTVQLQTEGHSPQSSKMLGSEDLGNFKEMVEDYEKQILLAAMKKNDYKITRAAQSLGLSRHSLRHHILRLFGQIPPWNDRSHL